MHKSELANNNQKLHTLTECQRLEAERKQAEEQLQRLHQELELLVQENAELRRENEMLRTSEARYRGCFENSPLSIVFIASDGRPVEANRAFERMYGMTIAQLSDRNFNIFNDPQLIENGTLSYMQRALAGESVMEPMTYYDADKTVSGGRFVWGQGFYYPVQDRAGVVEEIVEMAFDHTELVEAQALLQERETAQVGAAQCKMNSALQAEVAERRRAEWVARGQTEALVKTIKVLAAEPVLDNFLGYVLQAIAQQLGARSGGIYLYSETHDTTILHINYEDEQIQRGEQITHPGASTQNPPRQWDAEYMPSLRHNQVLIHDERHFTSPAYAPYSKNNAKRGIKTILVVPLLFGETFLGNITLRSTQQSDYQPEEIELARVLAYQATLAIQLTRLAQQSRSWAVLEERNRLARELHDTLGQAFTGIVMQLEAAVRFFDTKPTQARSCITRAQSLAKAGIVTAQQALRTLHQEANTYSNLPQALQGSVAEMTDGISVSVEISVCGTPISLPAEISQNLLRIAQEALTNALKHAQAQRIEIILDYTPQQVKLQVQDDGQGFALDRMQATSGGFGLVSMQQRAERIGAQLEIVTQAGSGTTVTAIAPLAAV